MPTVKTSDHSASHYLLAFLVGFVKCREMYPGRMGQVKLLQRFYKRSFCIIICVLCLQHHKSIDEKRLKTFEYPFANEYLHIHQPAGDLHHS